MVNINLILFYFILLNESVFLALLYETEEGLEIINYVGWWDLLLLPSSSFHSLQLSIPIVNNGKY